MVDNKWVVDDNQPKTNNNLGGENNVMSIDEDDFEVGSVVLLRDRVC